MQMQKQPNTEFVDESESYPSKIVLKTIDFQVLKPSKRCKNVMQLSIEPEQIFSQILVHNLNNEVKNNTDFDLHHALDILFKHKT
jgi:hypothetical protein